MLTRCAALYTFCCSIEIPSASHTIQHKHISTCSWNFPTLAGHDGKLSAYWNSSTHIISTNGGVMINNTTSICLAISRVGRAISIPLNFFPIILFSNNISIFISTIICCEHISKLNISIPINIILVMRKLRIASVNRKKANNRLKREYNCNWIIFATCPCPCILPCI